MNAFTTVAMAFALSFGASIPAVLLLYRYHLHNQRDGGMYRFVRWVAMPTLVALRLLRWFRRGGIHT
jgi:hypothetical protein